MFDFEKLIIFISLVFHLEFFNCYHLIYLAYIYMSIKLLPGHIIDYCTWHIIPGHIIPGHIIFGILYLAKVNIKDESFP